MKTWMIAGCLAAVAATGAAAEPGLGDEVYGARAEAGRTEIEARYGRLGGGPDNGTDALKLEATHHVSDRLRLAAFGEFSRDPGAPRRAEEAGFEAIYTLGRAAGIDFALYGEYALGFSGNPDAVEAKLIAERLRGPLDVRLNLVGEKPLAGHAPIELSYAARADYALGDVAVGLEAFGDLGTFSAFAPPAAHFVGPEARTEIEALGPELELTAGYLFALGQTRQDTKGQLRIALEMEF